MIFGTISYKYNHYLIQQTKENDVIIILIRRENNELIKYNIPYRGI